MPPTIFDKARAKAILDQGAQTHILVVGDVMLDRFVTGSVDRISPEAPVPVLRFESESLMPGGAANVARNLTALRAHTTLFSLIGRDPDGRALKQLLERDRVQCRGLRVVPKRGTGTKTRIVSQQQQIVRVDRETLTDLSDQEQALLEKVIQPALPSAAAVIIGDYAKGIINNSLLRFLKEECHRRGIWLSLDPKPAHAVDLTGFSLITPNRREAFELAGVSDTTRCAMPDIDDQTSFRSSLGQPVPANVPSRQDATGCNARRSEWLPSGRGSYRAEYSEHGGAVPSNRC